MHVDACGQATSVTSKPAEPPYSGVGAGRAMELLQELALWDQVAVSETATQLPADAQLNARPPESTPSASSAGTPPLTPLLGMAVLWLHVPVVSVADINEYVSEFS
jgi:hypothetical protein